MEALTHRPLGGRFLSTGFVGQFPAMLLHLFLPACPPPLFVLSNMIPALRNCHVPSISVPAHHSSPPPLFSVPLPPLHLSQQHGACPVQHNGHVSCIGMPSDHSFLPPLFPAPSTPLTLLSNMMPVLYSAIGIFIASLCLLISVCCAFSHTKREKE